MVDSMISATTQTLAELLARDLSVIGKEQISFHHPQTNLIGHPGLNLYCYHIQASPRKPLFSSSVLPPLLSTSAAVSPANYLAHTQANISASPNQTHPLPRFDLSFLISATDYTTLGEQHLLSEVLGIISNYECLPDEVIVPELKGLGILPIRVFNTGWADAIQLWNVLCAPLRPALQVNITVPFLTSHHRVLT